MPVDRSAEAVEFEGVPGHRAEEQAAHLTTARVDAAERAFRQTRRQQGNA